MLNVSKLSKFYVHIPSGVVTGGVELLHQLVHELRSLGREAYIVYYGALPHKVPKDYSDYNLAIATFIEDLPTNIEVYTEVMLTALKENNRCTQKLWWWLSVDFFFNKHQLKELSIRDIRLWDKKLAWRCFLSRAKWSILRRTNLFAGKILLKKFYGITCGYQCQYICKFLEHCGFTSLIHLSDYINKEHLGAFDTHNRKDIVLYNPLKGKEFTSKLINYASGIKFVPLCGMTRAELKDTIRSAKLYIDFGNHPGMDRLPRECAANGCCVITGVQGSAKYSEDVPLPEGYKFDELRCSLDRIVNKIHFVLNNYEIEIEKFNGYRSFIGAQKENFHQQVCSVFAVRT